MRMQVSSWIAASCLTLCSWSQVGFAGPWMDSLLNNRRAPAYPVGVPVAANYGGAANYGSVVANYGAYANPTNHVQNSAVTPWNSGYGPIPVGVPQTVPGILPTAGYDTQWNRIPVTYYRPVTSFDPRMGTTVTSLQPCTSYQYQAGRVPLVGPRPLLGEYGLQTNPWPGITGPGYNATGLGMTANYPGYQSLPTSGSFAPYGTTGSSMGMPASSLPVSTIPATNTTVNYGGVMPTVTSFPAYNTVNSFPTNPAPVAVMPMSTWQPYSTPAVSPSWGMTSQSVLPAGATSPIDSSFSQPINSFAPPVTSYGQPMNSLTPSIPSYAPQFNSYAQPVPYGGSTPIGSGCANGTCPLPANPNYGAPSSVLPPGNTPAGSGTMMTPLGPPTYSPMPSSSPIPSTSPVPSSNPGLPPVGSGPYPGVPGAPNDPESSVVPRLNSQASVQKATVDHLVKSPVPVTIPSTSSNVSKIETAEIEPPEALHGGLLPWNRDRDMARDALTQNVKSNRMETSLPIPETLKPEVDERSFRRPNPLRAPAGVDTKALWNSELINGNEPTASTAKPIDQPASGTKNEPSNIRFISGSLEKAKKTPTNGHKPVDSNDIRMYFRPISK